jgi:hypothetical protein
MMRTTTAVLALAVLGAPGSPQAGFTVDAAKKEVLVACKIAPRKLPNLPEIYPIEVIATHPAPKGQKAHETVVTTAAKPSEVAKALESLGLKAGKPARGDDAVGAGPQLEILLELPDKAAGKKRVSIESALVDRRTGRPLPPLTWHFTGSAMKQVDPAKPDLVYGADAAGTLVGIFPVTDELIVQSNLTMKEEGLIKLETDKSALPAEGTDAVLILRPASAKPAAPVSARSVGEAETFMVTHRMALGSAARPGQVAAPALPPTAAVDPFQHRRDVPPGKASPEEARPLALPPPPLPRDGK